MSQVCHSISRVVGANAADLYAALATMKKLDGPIAFAIRLLDIEISGDEGAAALGLKPEDGDYVIVPISDTSALARNRIRFHDILNIDPVDVEVLVQKSDGSWAPTTFDYDSEIVDAIVERRFP